MAALHGQGHVLDEIQPRTRRHVSGEPALDCIHPVGRVDRRARQAVTRVPKMAEASGGPGGALCGPRRVEN